MDRVFTERVKKRVIIVMVISMARDELVKERSTPPTSKRTKGVISNCSSGLCFADEDAILYLRDI